MFAASSIQVRNKGFTKADYEAVFKEYLGITNVIWLGDGIEATILTDI